MLSEMNSNVMTRSVVIGKDRTIEVTQRKEALERELRMKREAKIKEQENRAAKARELKEKELKDKIHQRQVIELQKQKAVLDRRCAQLERMSKRKEILQKAHESTSRTAKPKRKAIYVFGSSTPREVSLFESKTYSRDIQTAPQNQSSSTNRVSTGTSSSSNLSHQVQQPRNRNLRQNAPKKMTQSVYGAINNSSVKKTTALENKAKQLPGKQTFSTPQPQGKSSVKKNEPIRSAPKPVMVQKHPLVTNAQGKDENIRHEAQSDGCFSLTKTPELQNVQDMKSLRNTIESNNRKNEQIMGEIVTNGTNLIHEDIYPPLNGVGVNKVTETTVDLDLTNNISNSSSSSFRNETYETVMNTGNVTQAIAELQSPSANEIAFLEDKDHEMLLTDVLASTPSIVNDQNGFLPYQNGVQTTMVNESQIPSHRNGSYMNGEGHKGLGNETLNSNETLGNKTPRTAYNALAGNDEEERNKRRLKVNEILKSVKDEKGKQSSENRLEPSAFNNVELNC